MKKLWKIFAIILACCCIATLFTACNNEHDKIAEDYATLHGVEKSSVDFTCYGEFGGTHVIMFNRIYPDALSTETVDGVTFHHSQIKTFDVYNGGNFYSLQEAFNSGLLNHDNLVTLRDKYNPQ